MTPNISSAKRSPAMRRCGFTLRELFAGRISFLLWTFLLFIILPVASLLKVGKLSNPPSDTQILRAIADPLYTAMYFMVFAAFLSGILMFSIFHNRRSAYFYLSLPIRRSHLFLSRLLGCALPPVAAYLLNFLLSLLLFSTSPDISLLSILPSFLKIGGQTLLLFLWTLAGTVLASSLASRGFDSALFSLWFFSALPAYYAAFTSIFSIGMPTAKFSETISDLIWRFAPLLRATQLSLNAHYTLLPPLSEDPVGAAGAFSSFSPWEIPVILALSLLLLGIALLITRKRPAENAGESAVFPRFGEFQKFTVLIPGGIFIGLFLYTILSHVVVLYSGILLGMFLCFFLLNLLIYRSGKKLFVNFKIAVLLTVAVIALVFGLIFCANALEGRDWTPENTNRILIYCDSVQELSVAPEECEELLPVLNRLRREEEKSTATGIVSETVPETVSDTYGALPFHILLYPDFGPAVQQFFRLTEESDIAVFLSTLIDADEGQGLSKNLLPQEGEEISDIHLSLLDSRVFGEGELTVSAAQAETLLSRRIAELRSGSAGGFAVGVLEYFLSDGSALRMVSLPIYEGDLALFGKTFDSDALFSSIVMAEYYLPEWKAKAGSGVDTLVTVTDPQEIRRLAENSTGSGDSAIFNRGTDQRILFYRQSSAGETDFFFAAYLRSGVKLSD